MDINFVNYVQQINKLLAKSVLDFGLPKLKQTLSDIVDVHVLAKEEVNVHGKSQNDEYVH